MASATKTKKAASAAADEQANTTSLVPVSGDMVSILKNEQGQIKIHQEVVAKIAGLAVREVEGVHALVPFGTGQRLSSVASAIAGSDMKDLGVHVEVGEVEAAVDVRIITTYGESIPAVTRNIQQNVHQRIGTMTGLKVTEVNIEVVDLFFENSKPIEQAPKTEPRVK